jgi:iron complex outermembrane recepter protein
MKQVSRLISVLGASLLMAGAVSYGQAPGAATINGEVLDDSGGVVPQALIKVQLLAAGGVHTTSSAQDGTFSVKGLPAGTYRLAVTRPGFAEFTQDLTLGEAGQQAVTVKLGPESLNESIRVTATTDEYPTQASSTATKLEASWLDIPQNVEVVNRKILDDQAAFQLADAGIDAGGVSRTKTQTSGSTGDEFTIRGFQLDPENSYLRDGLKFSAYSIADLADVEQVEILEGPAAALYGRTQPGGVVNLISKKPLDTTYASAQFTGSNDEFYRPEIDLSGPIIHGLTYRLNADYQHDFNLVNTVHGDHYFLAPALLWKIGSATTLLLTGEAVKVDEVSNYGVPAVGNRIASVPITTSYGEPFNSGKSHPFQAGYLLHHNFSAKWSVENRLSLGGTGYQYYEVYPTDVSVAANGQLQVDRSSDNFGFPEHWIYSQTEVVGKMKTGKIRHDVLIGLELDHASQGFTGSLGDAPSVSLYNPVLGQFPIQGVTNALSPANAFVTFDIPSTTHSISGYLQDLVTLSARIKLLAGARFEAYHQNTVSFGTSYLSSQVATSPRVGLVFGLTPNASLYFSYIKSFNPFDPSWITQSGQTFSPEHANQYEGGLKYQAFHQRLATTLAVYRIHRDNAVTTDPANPNFYVEAGPQRSKGVTLDVVGKLNDHWNFWLAYGFTQAQVAGGTFFPIGNVLPEAPRHLGNVWTTYEFARRALQGLGVGGGLHTSTFKQGDLPNSYLLPGYARLDASVWYRIHRSNEKTNWRVSLNIKNALDRHYWEESNGGFARPGNSFAAYSSIRMTWY